MALEQLRPQILQMFALDAHGSHAFGKAGAMPKDTDEQKAQRKFVMQAALKGATESPEKTARLCVDAFKHVAAIAKVGKSTPFQTAALARSRCLQPSTRGS